MLTILCFKLQLETVITNIFDKNKNEQQYKFEISDVKIYIYICSTKIVNKHTAYNTHNTYS